MTLDEAVEFAACEGMAVTMEKFIDVDVMRKSLRLAGFAIVPVVPTDKMILSGAERERSFKDRDGFTTAKGPVGEAVAHSVYRAMIAAYEKEMGDG